MSIGAIFAALLQLHVCSASDFTKPDGTTLRVIVCPVVLAPPGDEEPEPPPPRKVPT